LATQIRHFDRSRLMERDPYRERHFAGSCLKHSLAIYGWGVEFVIARNPDPASTLPFLVRLPVGSRPVVLNVKDTWPRTADLVLDRARENRSQ